MKQILAFVIMAFSVQPATAQVRPLATELAASCATPFPDQDRDGLSDGCELTLAQYFAPLLMVAPGGCNWDDSVEPARLGGGYLFAVQASGRGVVRIAYLPAYYRDCGWTGVKCWLPFVDCAPHVGDSEFIVIEAARLDHAWYANAVFLSAHCFGRHGASCRWYARAELSTFAWDGPPMAAPVIWVAEGRQANYPTRQACDRGIHAIDTCDRNSLPLRYPIISNLQNVGSMSMPAHQHGCVSGGAIWNSRRENTEVTECFWDRATPFAGWQNGSGVTPYHKYLVEVAGFDSTITRLSD